MAEGEEDDSALTNMDKQEINLYSVNSDSQEDGTVNKSPDSATSEVPLEPISPQRKKNTKPPPKKEKITKSKGLKLKTSNKLKIVDEDMDITQFLQVIGPLYIMKNIAESPGDLPDAPINPRMQEEKPHDDVVDDFQNPKLSTHPPETDLSDSDELESQTETWDEIIKSTLLSSETPRKRDPLGNSRIKRGLVGNKFIQRKFQYFLPKNKRSAPYNLQVLDQKPVLSMVGTNSVIKYDEKDILYMPRLRLGKSMPFKIVNTVSRLDKIPIRNDKTVFLQWANVGEARSIRNIRIDGISDEKSILERFAFYLDQKFGPSAVWFIDKYKSYILLFALFCFLLLSWRF